MITKVSTMNSVTMETECRRMADSYLDFEMTGRNLGMCEHLDKEHFYRFTRGYFESAIRNGSLYCAGDNKEGYFIFETPETKRTLYGSFLQAKWMLSSFGLKKGIQYIKEIMNSGIYLASEFSKQKKLFTKIEFIAVAKEHQGQGYMRRMMEYAFSESDRLGLPLILTTDDEKKVRIYEHFGMKMVREHIVSDRAIYYEMLREGNKGYRKSKLKAGGNSHESYIQIADQIPAAFRHERKTGKGITEDFYPGGACSGRDESSSDKDKAARYEHLGMKLERVRNCGERFHMYDLIRECDERKYQ